jgi:hypothetical protein
VLWKKAVSVQFAGAVGRQPQSVGHFRVVRGSQGTDCGCVVMSAECRDGPSCAIVAIVSCTPHSDRQHQPQQSTNYQKFPQDSLTVLTPTASLKLCSASRRLYLKMNKLLSWDFLWSASLKTTFSGTTFDFSVYTSTVLCGRVALQSRQSPALTVPLPSPDSSLPCDTALPLLLLLQLLLLLFSRADPDLPALLLLS